MVVGPSSGGFGDLSSCAGGGGCAGSGLLGVGGVLGGERSCQFPLRTGAEAPKGLVLWSAGRPLRECIEVALDHETTCLGCLCQTLSQC